MSENISKITEKLELMATLYKDTKQTNGQTETRTLQIMEHIKRLEFEIKNMHACINEAYVRFLITYSECKKLAL